MKVLNPFSSGWAARRNFYVSHSPGVVIEPVEHVEKSIDAISTRKYQPIVLKGIANQFAEFHKVFRCFHPDCRQFVYVRPENSQFCAQRASLFSGPRNDDPPAEQRPLFEPMQFVPQFNDSTEHRNRRRLKSS